MKVWLDSLTPKQFLLAYHIGKRLESQGHIVKITCRRYDYIMSLIKLYNVKSASCIGDYGENLEEKLVKDINRMSGLISFIRKFKPELLISYPSPSAIRVAFGLKIPIICITDSPHSTIVNRLTLPLVNILIIPKCIPREAFERFIVKGLTKVISYNGVDEVEFLRNFKPSKKALSELGLNVKDTIVVVRPEESKASYYTYNFTLEPIVDSLINLNVKVVYFPRYKEQLYRLSRKFKDKIIIPPKAIDTRSLFYYSTLVISGGATMAREAALLGTPSIYTFPEKLYVNEWIRDLGFPLYHITDTNKAINFITGVIGGRGEGEYDRKQALKMLSKLESPGDIVEKIVNEYEAL